MPQRVERSPFERAVAEGLVRHPRSNDGSNPVKAWIEPFLTAIMGGASIRGAVAQVGIDLTLPYKTRQTDEAFRVAWAEAMTVGTEFLEAEAQRRAYHGVEEPVFHKGVECGHIRKYSDTLLIFLLKARRPDKYREGIEDGGGMRNMVVNINVETVTERPPEQITIDCNPDTSSTDSPPVGSALLTVAGLDQIGPVVTTEVPTP